MWKVNGKTDHFEGLVTDGGMGWRELESSGSGCQQAAALLNRAVNICVSKGEGNFLTM